MWDTVPEHRPGERRLSHDLPCTGCGHAVHTYLACGDGCSCPPVSMPGAA